MSSDPYYILDSAWTDPGRIRRERERARALKKTHWWHQKIARAVCEYCEKRVAPQELTMDHVVPLARGGGSTKGNLVAACATCNQSKKLHTPVDIALASGVS